MSMINKEIGAFSAQAYLDNNFKTITKEDVLGKWSIFFFYPADFTFVCPTELEDLANIYDKFVAVGAEIYSVSTDTHFVHKAWHDHSERISKLQACQFVHTHGEEVCPAKWQPGAETLKPSLDLVGML